MKYFDKLSLEEKVLYKVCYRSCGLDMSGFDCITTTSYIAESLNVSQYKVRKALKNLESHGLVKRVCEGGCADDELRVFCVKGWIINPVVRHTMIYKRANWESSKCVGHCWDIVPSQFYATQTAEWFIWQKTLDRRYKNV